MVLLSVFRNLHGQEETDGTGGTVGNKILKLVSFIIVLAFGASFGMMPFFIKRCRNSTKFLGLANSFSGGIFLGIGLFHLLPEGLEKLEGNEILSDFRLGFALPFMAYSLILFVEKVAFNSHSLIAHDHSHGHEHKEIHDQKQKINKLPSQKYSQEKEKHKHDEIQDIKIEALIENSISTPAQKLIPQENTNEENPDSDDEEETIKNIISNKGQMASFLFMRNSLINNNLENIKPKSKSLYKSSKILLNLDDNKEKIEDLLVDPKQIDISDTEENHHHEHIIPGNSLTPYILLIALGLHGFFEGLALGIQSEFQGTLFILMAILAHKWAESLTLGISFVKARTSKKTFLKMMIIFSFFGPLGIVIGFILAEETNEIVEGICLTFSTGTFLYVACSEVIVEEFALLKYKWSKFFLYFAGAALTYGLALIELIQGHEHNAQVGSLLLKVFLTK